MSLGQYADELSRRQAAYNDDNASFVGEWTDSEGDEGGALKLKRLELIWDKRAEAKEVGVDMRHRNWGRKVGV